MIGRREFITLLGGAATAWPIPSRVQQPTVLSVGLLTSSQQDDRWLGALRQGVRRQPILLQKSVEGYRAQ